MTFVFYNNKIDFLKANPSLGQINSCVVEKVFAVLLQYRFVFKENSVIYVYEKCTYICSNAYSLKHFRKGTYENLLS